MTSSTPTHKQKLYCYVDETGQDTKGKLFIVSVVITGDERDELLEKLEAVEQATGKGRVKWLGAKDALRVAYIKTILTIPAFKGMLHYSFYSNTTDYTERTVISTARAITILNSADYEAIVLVDGLPKSRVGSFATKLRHLHIKTKKVRGVRKEESDALIRLADAVCGFTRAALTGRTDLNAVFMKAKREGFIREV